MRTFSRLVLLLLFAGGLCWPASARVEGGDPPCPSRTVFLVCVPQDALAALRALAAADAPCHVKVIEAARTVFLPGEVSERVVYAALGTAGGGLSVGTIDPPPRF